MNRAEREERLLAACLLSAAGGFTDIYSYLFRGGVFANAVTGNLVIMGLRLASGDAWGTLHGLCAVVAYGAGVLAANAIHARYGHRRRVGWHQVVLWVEAALLLVVVSLPNGAGDFAVAAVISFVCALQVETFRKVRGNPFATTMCTGNLRSGTEAIYHALTGGKRTSVEKGLCYYAVIACFIAGAALGAWLTGLAPQRAVLGAAGFQLAAFGLMCQKGRQA